MSRIVDVMKTYQRHLPKVKISDGFLVVISDLHVPYHMEESIRYIAEEFGDTRHTYLVINGDLMDSTNISSFPSTAKHAIFEEVVEANNIVKYLASKFKQVFLLDGNHERRLLRYLGKQAREISEFLPETFNYYVSRNIEIKHGMIVDHGAIENVLYTPTKYFLINNAVFIHPQNYSIVPGGTVRKAIDDAISHRVPFDIMVIGHTHKIAYINHLGRVGIETGCLTNHDDYISKPARLAPAPQLGFATLNIKNGICTDPRLYDLTYMFNSAVARSEML